MPVRVLVVDDSPFVCRLLASHLRSDPDVEPVGPALSGERAVELVETLRPDVVTLDLEMPGMGGLEALARIMARRPTPVVLMTGVSRKAAEATVAALDAGAIDFVPKYTPGMDTDPDDLRKTLLAKVKLAAGVKVIRSLGRPPTRPRPAAPAPSDVPAVVVVAASTGGPAAVRDLLAGLGPDFPIPVVVVQHMPAAFTKAFADQLARQLPFAVTEAAAGDTLRPGRVLIAPGDRHLILKADGRVELSAGPKANGHRPAADVTLESAAAAFGPRAAGVVLTGMGDDGARGLLAVRRAGGATFAQCEDGCVVFGMPARAAEVGAAGVIDTPAGIAGYLESLCKPPALVPLSPWGRG